MQKYIAYYRVSTQKQGVSGLGLEAQVQAVKSFLMGYEPIASFKDIESGKNNFRPELLRALELAKKENAVLLVAKLDRLSRDVVFIGTLQNSHIRFTCCDMPEANELTIGLMSVLAQWERKQISTRTSAALQAKKARGEKLGNAQNFSQAGRDAGVRTRKYIARAHPNNIRARAYAVFLRNSGMSLPQIANELNNGGFKTSKDSTFFPMQVSRLLDRK